ncbi:MAG: glycosyl transferase, partial [Butyrivibrio sp.]|nr:glycosyl transferase [Butyrivibrio sp.]
AFTSDELQFAIAPKYWARHNVSDGYWASEQNIYSCFHYMDKHGKLFSPEECRKELEQYKKRSGKYKRLNVRATGLVATLQKLHAKWLYGLYMFRKIIRSLERRTGLIKIFHV